MALDIRKFEIDLYWKRATYFWAFIAATFAGYFLLISKYSEGGDTSGNEFYWRQILIVCVLGFLFSFTWYLVNRGSKFWQNNWERHVDYLEDEVMGPLYKLVLNPKENKSYHFLSEYPFFVSKINQLSSLLVCIVWAMLIFGAIKKSFTNLDYPCIIIIEAIFIGLLVLLYYCLCRSNLVSEFQEDKVLFYERKIK
ncbi:hypothetical protein IAQ67_07740 [Paenibacillus peoriae]|uniref:Uncharacterized protein n=1 Tax=Paenibacillus peoriae TaxID=59893 RepID=A0A7H0YCV5_9BACL|nr:hypothetical protein [Paenibacillus peoriae]QNR68913.1 hypothetical protein IAQ67_07740 [Paenibacillus peoriae]